MESFGDHNSSSDFATKPEKQCSNTLFIAEFSIEKQDLKHEIKGVEIATPFGQVWTPGCVDLCTCFLPILATSSKRVSSMLNGLTIHCEPVHNTDLATDLIQQAANCELDIYKYVDD